MNYNINRGTILGVASNEDVFRRGEKYYLEGKIVESTLTDDDTILIYVEGNYKNYEVQIVFENSGTLKSYKCNCESHSIWRGACKHVIASLFALADKKINYP